MDIGNTSTVGVALNYKVYYQVFPLKENSLNGSLTKELKLDWLNGWIRQ